jgi:hypothetical protein
MKNCHKRRKINVGALTVFLLSVLVFSQNISIPAVYALNNNQINNHPSDRIPMVLPLSTSSSCLDLSVSNVRASGEQDISHRASYSTDYNFGTRWANFGRGSWIQGDLGTQKIVCSLDIAWYLGNERHYNFVISLSNDGSTFTRVFTGISSGTTSSFERYSLTTDTTARFVRITVNGNTANDWASIVELRVNGYTSTTPPPPTSNLYDNFEGTSTYALSSGQTSPDGKWVDVYNGYGSAGTQNDGTGSGNRVFYMYPKEPPPPPDTTEASLVTSTQKWSNFDLSIDVKTVQQLRQNGPPHSWETAWVFFRYIDPHHHYYFLVKPTGIEFGKKDCDSCSSPDGDQKFLVTASSPTLKIGAWSNWKITAIGNHITIAVDGTKVIDYVDQTMSSKLSTGAIGMYNEDAYAQFDNVYVTTR